MGGSFYTEYETKDFAGQQKNNFILDCKIKIG